MSTVTWWHPHASAHGWRRWMLLLGTWAVEGAARVFETDWKQMLVITKFRFANQLTGTGNLHKMPSASSKCTKSLPSDLCSCNMTKTSTCSLWFTVMREAPRIHHSTSCAATKHSRPERDSWLFYQPGWRLRKMHLFHLHISDMEHA